MASPFCRTATSSSTNGGGGESCAYNQYDPTTGAVIPETTIVVPSHFECSGVATNGTSLDFHTLSTGGEVNSFTFIKTDLTGFVIATKTVIPNFIADISLVTFGANGVPGNPAVTARLSPIWPNSMEASTTLPRPSATRTRPTCRMPLNASARRRDGGGDALRSRPRHPRRKPYDLSNLEILWPGLTLGLTRPSRHKARH